MDFLVAVGLAYVLVCFICWVNIHSHIARSYSRWTWLLDARLNKHLYTAWINLITPTLATLVLAPLITLQYVFCLLLNAVIPCPIPNGKWSFCRFRLVYMQLVWHSGRLRPMYRRLNGELL